MTRRNSGFTIVELLIVIVVIGILAAITIVTYTNVQERARDSIRKSDLNNIAKAMQMYNIDHGNMARDCGSTSNSEGNGWFNHVNTSTYTTSVMSCLLPYTNNAVIADPSGQTSCSGYDCRAYMKYTCLTGARQGTWIYANLESLPNSDSATNDTCSTGADSAYGMNYYIKVD